jgi:penicillin-binding protein 2
VEAQPSANQCWYAGDTISAGIGQGYVTATPFQLAVMCARMAGGDADAGSARHHQRHEHARHDDRADGRVQARRARSRPRRHVRVTSEGGGTAIRFGALDEKNDAACALHRARDGGKIWARRRCASCQRAERDARGEAIKNDKLPWKLRDHALFVAYAPTDKPRYAVAVVVEHGGSGSSVARRSRATSWLTPCA